MLCMHEMESKFLARNIKPSIIRLFWCDFPAAEEWFVFPQCARFSLKLLTLSRLLTGMALWLLGILPSRPESFVLLFCPFHPSLALTERRSPRKILSALLKPFELLAFIPNSSFLKICLSHLCFQSQTQKAFKTFLMDVSYANSTFEITISPICILRSFYARYTWRYRGRLFWIAVSIGAGNSFSCCNTVCGSSKQSMIRNSSFCAFEVAKICAHDLTRIPNKKEK